MRETDRTGYTLIEVIVVMLVMGILAAAAVPSYLRSAAHFRVEAAARRVVADLEHARSLAVMKGSTELVRVTFYPSSDRYEMMNIPDPDHPSNGYWVDFANTAYPVDLVSATFTNTSGKTSSLNRIKFDIYGNPRSAWDPEAPLASGQIVLTSGSATRTVVIDPVTGKASVQ